MVLPTKVSVSKSVSKKKPSNDVDWPYFIMMSCLLFVIVMKCILYGHSLYMYMHENGQHQEFPSHSPNANSCVSIDDKTRMQLAAQTTDALYNYPNDTYGRMIWSKFGGEGGCIDYFSANGVQMYFLREVSDCNNTVSQSWRLGSDGLLVNLADYPQKSGKNCSDGITGGTDLCIYPQPSSFFITINKCQPDLTDDRVYFTLNSITKPNYCLGLIPDTFIMTNAKAKDIYLISIGHCNDAEDQRFYLDDVIYDYEGQ